MPCFFCREMADSDSMQIALPALQNGLFMAVWDGNPVTPGHILVVPRRHVQYMRDLSADEAQALIPAVVEVKKYLMTADLGAVYHTLLSRTEKSPTNLPYLERAQAKLKELNRSAPDAFNDGLNDGPAAGQTVPHFHWHIMPRWEGDDADPRGGIRHMFAGLGNYHHGLQR